MKFVTVDPSKINRIKYPEEKILECFDRLKREIEDIGNLPIVRYVNLCGIKVRIEIYDSAFMPTVDAYLGPSLVNNADSFDYTIVLWKTKSIKTEPKCFYQIESRDSNQSEPVFSLFEGGITGFEKISNTFYCGRPNCTLERLTLAGDVFVMQFYRILKSMPNKSIVHGACVGIDGKGALLCARAGKGKSTLAVSALLEGFEYVADDYLILDSVQGVLRASPIYSVVKLSHHMYDLMRDKIENAIILTDIPRKKKYSLNISCWRSQFRENYPIRVCLLPEIAPEQDEPSIIKCKSDEKVKGIINMVLSTTSQVMDIYDNVGRAKLMKMLQDQEFYRIRLCGDIYRNVECLRDFLRNKVD